MYGLLLHKGNDIYLHALSWVFYIYSMTLFYNNPTFSFAFIFFFLGAGIHLAILVYTMDKPRIPKNSLKTPNSRQRITFISFAMFHFCWSALSLQSRAFSEKTFFFLFWIFVGLNGLYFLASGLIKSRFNSGIENLVEEQN